MLSCVHLRALTDSSSHWPVDTGCWAGYKYTIDHAAELSDLVGHPEYVYTISIYCCVVLQASSMWLAMPEYPAFYDRVVEQSSKLFRVREPYPSGEQMV